MNNSTLGNILIEKIWEDELIFEVRLRVESKYVNAWQTCYFDSVSLDKLCYFISGYCKGTGNANYYESGDKTGNYTPSFSMSLSNNSTGHITIEMDLEINDVEDRSHRCICNVYTELGLLEKFAKNVHKLIDADIGSTVSLLDI